MFKSVFAKYVTVFMVIITLGFALLLLIVTSIVNNYSATVKRDVMENAAGATRVALEATVYDSQPQDFSRLLTQAGAEQVRNLLDEFADRDDDLAVVVLDPIGNELYTTVGGDWTPEVPRVYDLPVTLFDTVNAGSAFSADYNGEKKDDISY